MIKPRIIQTKTSCCENKLSYEKLIQTTINAQTK